MFAGIYKINITYNPFGIPLGDSIYYYYHNTDQEIPDHLLPMTTDGEQSNWIDLTIRRSNDNIVSIESRKYFVIKENDLYFYLTENLPKPVTDIRCEHITNLPPDSCSLPNGEYFYSHFNNLYAEYVVRFNDGDIRQYRRFLDTCPDYLYTEQYNESKQILLHAFQMTDKHFYSVTYHQPSGKINQETTCNPQGTLCTVITYIYDKNGNLKNIILPKTNPA